MTNQAQADASTGRCAATRADGTPCRAHALPGRSCCWAHDQDQQERAAEARRRGGQNRGNLARIRKATPDALKEAQDRLIEALRAVQTGDMDPRIGTAMATISSALVKVHEAGELAVRVEELEGRLEQ